MSESFAVPRKLNHIRLTSSTSKPGLIEYKYNRIKFGLFLLALNLIEYSISLILVALELFKSTSDFCTLTHQGQIFLGGVCPLRRLTQSVDPWSSSFKEYITYFTNFTYTLTS